MMETAEDYPRHLQPVRMVMQCMVQSVHLRIKPRSVQTVDLAVFEIYGLNNLGNRPQTFAIAQAESLQHRFKGAILTMMREFRAIHVERNRAFCRLALSNKVKARALIDELFD